MARAFVRPEDFFTGISASKEFIHIFFNEADVRRWVRATTKVTETVFRERGVNSHLNAIHFSNLLRRNISTQRHMGGYAPLNTRYKEWKRSYGRSGREFWALFGDLLRNISPTKIGSNAWLGGVRPGSRHSGGTSWLGRGDKTSGSRDLTEIGRFAEFGRKGQPARPIVEPTTEEYSKDRWLKEAESSLRKMANKWR